MKKITPTDQDLIIDLTKNEQRQTRKKRGLTMIVNYTDAELKQIEQIEDETAETLIAINDEIEIIKAKDPKSPKIKELIEKRTRLFDTDTQKRAEIYNKAKNRAFKKISGTVESIVANAKEQAELILKNFYLGYQVELNKKIADGLPAKEGNNLREKIKQMQNLKMIKDEVLIEEQSAIDFLRVALNLHLEALKGKHSKEYKEVDDYIIKVVANSPYVYRKEVLSPIDYLKKDKEPFSDFYYMYHSKPTNALISMSSKNAKSKDLYGKNAIIEKDDVKLEIIDFNSIRGALGVSTNKLLSAALIEFTKQNTEADLTKNNINTRVSIPLKDYALACGYEVEEKITKNMNKEEIEKEKERASNALKYARKQINKDLNILFASKVSWKETSKRFKNKDFMDYRFIVGKGIRKGRIHIEFYSGFSDNMVQQAITPHPLALFKVDAGKPTAYAIGRKMATHYGMNNNIIKGTYNRLKVQTLLDVTDLPTLENVRQSRNSWYERIKEPLENALDHLTSKEVNFLKDWTYCKPLGKTMTKEEANFTNKPFEEWANTLILFEVVDAPSYKDRLKQLEEKKKENIKKKKGK
jgi:hypothetical protein